MVSSVLVPMDGSEMAEKALEFAVESYPDAEFTVLHVAGVPTPYFGEIAGLALADDFEEAVAADAEPIFERASELAAEEGVELGTRVALGMPGRAIVEAADEYDVVVIGSHGRDLSARLLLGNVAETVTRRAPVPVLVVR